MSEVEPPADDDDVAIQREKPFDELTDEERRARLEEIARPFREGVGREFVAPGPVKFKTRISELDPTSSASGVAEIGRDDEAKHPVEAVAGKYVRVADLIAATVANPNGSGQDHAFSDSTRHALNIARLVPRRRAVDGERLIGPDSFIRAILWIASESTSPPSTLGEALVAQLRSASNDSSLQTRLRALVSESSSNVPTEQAAVSGVDRALADPDLTNALADAAQIARQLEPGQIRVDVTHAIVAMLRTESGQRVLHDLEVVTPSPQEFFVRLADTVRRYLESSARAARTETVLDSIHASLSQVRGAAPERRSPVRYVADGPALSLADDRLGMGDDARALAEVICLRQPGPPLAIGLFGDWGSGKSTFMNMLEEAITQLTSEARKDAAAAETLVSGVVHIRFNAWHYNDGNLWASLTSEFFSQLRAGGWRQSSTKTYATLVREVLVKVQSLEVSVGMNEAAGVEAHKQALALQAEIDALQQRRKTVTSDALSTAAGDIVRGADAATFKRIESAAAVIGHPVTGGNAKPEEQQERLTAFVEREVEHAASLPGRIGVFLRAVWGVLRARAGRLTALLLWASIPLVIALWLQVPWTALQRLAASTTALLLTLVPGVIRIYRTVEPIFRGGDLFVRRRREAREQFERDIASKRVDLEEAQGRERQAEQERTSVEQEAARFRDATPARVFDYYLNASTDTRQFERQLGTVSQVRRAFEQLDAIFRQRETLRASVANAKETTEKEGLIKQLQELNAQTQGVDRIILYIDDLDRCQASQVVKVLEAVHLLLAFPLFVVVVGVDARWLEQSLLNFYERQLRDMAFGAPASEAGRQQNNPATGPERRATVQDYLEKIFQIPIRLQRLPDATDPNVKRYLQSVAGPIEDDTDERASGTQTERSESSSNGALHPVAVTPAPDAESARATVTRLQLKRPELTMIEALSPLLGKSPRAVKRFMNIYRLARGRRRGTDLDAFITGSAGAPALFAAHQFWLALDVGIRTEDADLYWNALYRAITHDHEHAAIAVDLQSLPDDGTPRRHAIALRAVAKALPGEAGLAALIDAKKEVARFSLRAR